MCEKEVNKLPILVDGEENVTFSHHIHPTWEKPFYAALYSPARGLAVAMRIRELDPILLHQKLFTSPGLRWRRWH